VLVAVDLLALGTGDHGALAAEDAWLGMGQRRAPGLLPGGGGEAVAVALVEVRAVIPLSPGGRGEGTAEAGDGLFQHLRLLALVMDVVEQPQLVPVRARVGGEVEEVAAAQARLVALALGLALVGAVALQRALGQVLAAAALGETAGVVVVFQIRLGLALVRRFELQARLLEVVVAAGDAAGTGGQAQGEALDHRLVGHQAAVLLVGRRCEPGKAGLVVAEHQHMALGAVLEVIVDAFFLAQALDEVQVALVVLHAVVARRVPGAELEALAAALEDAVFAQYLGDDLRHRQVLEDALVDAVAEPGQLRTQAQVVAGQALAGVALGAGMDLGVDALAVGIEARKAGWPSSASRSRSGRWLTRVTSKAKGWLRASKPVNSSTCRSCSTPGRVRLKCVW